MAHVVIVLTTDFQGERGLDARLLVDGDLSLEEGDGIVSERDHFTQRPKQT